MVAQEACPDQSQLESLLSGTLPPNDETQVSLHLERCPACQTTFEELARESKWLPDGEIRADQRAESALLQVMEKLAGEGPEAADHGETSRGEEPYLPFLAPSDSPEYLGRLGPYNVVGVIGQGGMGIVLKAHDPRLNRFVAIKVLAPQLAAYTAARKRFLREAQAAAALNHDHIVTIHDVDEVNGFPYIVMEYVVGVSLAQQIANGQPLELTDILRIGSQIASGLAAAHARGLIHRDIKTANILLESSGGKVKITDFGLARTVDEAHITQTGQIAGTPEYMSPEQAGGQPLDHRSDLFSLGCVLYAMCCGRSPFRAKTTWETIGKVRNEEPSALRKLNPATPDWLSDIVARLLAKNSDDRIQSAAEVADLLDRRLTEQREAPAGRCESLPPAARRWGAGPVAAVSLLTVFVGLAAFQIVINITRKGDKQGAKTTIRVGEGSDITVNNDGSVDVQLPPKGAEASPLKRIRSFTPNDKTITRDGITLDGDAWRVEGKQDRTVRLFEVADPGVEDCTVIYRAKLKSDALDGKAYLEMWCRSSGVGESFSKGLECPVTGTTDWASYEIPFFLKKGESSDLIKLNLVTEGKGTLWIKDIELLKGPPMPQQITTEPASPPEAASDAKPAATGNASQLARQGWALWQKGEMADAAVKFEQAVKLAPKNEAAWNGLGWANLNSGKMTEAKEAFQRLIAINPSHPAALNGMGQLALMQRKYDEAEPYLLKSAASPGASAAWYGLAKLYLLQEKYDKAEKWARKIVDSDQADDGAKQMLEAAKGKHLSDELRQLIEPPKIDSESEDEPEH